jgi:Tol biopolymer transport system component
MFKPVRSKPLSRLTLLIALPGIAVLVGTVACGAGSGGATLHTGTPTTLAFSSYRALDGSDALNSSQSDGTLPVANIWIVQSDGTGITPITKLSGSAVGGDSRDPQWSPDGNKIVYSSGRALDGSANPSAGGAINVWVSNADGSGATAVTQMTVYAPCWGAAWSPDGTRIAYFSWRGLGGSNADPGGQNSPRNIWVVNADGSNNVPVTQLTASATDSYYPRWSPDGTKLVFYSGRALDGSDAANGAYSTQNIWIVNADGTGAVPVTQLSNVLGGYQDAYWSRDASTFLFAGNGISTVHADGSALTQLMSGNELNALNIPEGWSPDGSRILFESTLAPDGSNGPQGSSNIWTMNADGSGATALTGLNVAGAGSGVWSADGTRIAYISDRGFDGRDVPDADDPVGNLWVMQADGAGSVALTKITKADSNPPAWKP